MSRETIATITTPIGEGGISVIQVSGPHSLLIVNAVFRGKKQKDLRNAVSKRLYYGEIYENGNTIDEVIVNVLRKKDSFTGEDLVEVNCHGGILAVKKTLECIVSAGAKKAHWVELTRCALTNSQIDLIQKEALIEIPQAKTRLGAKILLDQYNSALSSFIINLIIWIDNVKNIRSCETTSSRTSISDGHLWQEKLYYIHDKLEEILETAAFGCAITSPQRLIITGKPNVGKSTLINALLKEERSIVHAEPGTTSDAVDSMISIDGIPLTIIDTAGIRETSHKVEELGVLESKRQLKQADKIMFILDNSKPIEKEDKELMKFILDKLRQYKTDNNFDKVPVVTVVNKIDLPRKLNLSALEEEQLNPICRISAIKGDGISRLEENLIAKFKKYTEYVPKRPIIFTKRQQKNISNAFYTSEQYIQLIKEGKNVNNHLGLLNDIKQSLHNCIRNSQDKIA